MLNYIITDNTITVLLNNKPMVVDASDSRFEQVTQMIIDNCTEEELIELLDTAKIIENFGEGNIKVISGEVYYNDKIIRSALTNRITTMMEKGFDIKPLLKFTDNLYKNPSKRAVDETYTFLEACNLPITEDGYFLAYKKVRSDYTDVHSGTFDNSVGETCSMPRNEVDEDSTRTCSAGLHVASYSYMAHYPGEKIVICKINPANVVAVPQDYNNAKMRVCEYEVVGEVELEDDELTPNFIKNNEIPNINDELYEMDTNVIKEYLQKLIRNNDFDTLTYYVDEKGFDGAFEYMNSINKNTSFWKDKLMTEMLSDLDIV